jgi:hypothetical protein
VVSIGNQTIVFQLGPRYSITFGKHRPSNCEGASNDRVSTISRDRTIPSFIDPSFYHMSWSTCCEQVKASLHAHGLSAYFTDWHRSIRSLFFGSSSSVTLDSMKPRPLVDMGFLYVGVSNVPYPIDFKPRVPDMELRRMMQNHPNFE